MPYQMIGICSLCNGDVLAYVGPWAGVGPAPGPKCGSCGARPARGPVIPMERPRASHGGYVAPLEWEVQVPAVVTAMRIARKEIEELHARTDKRVREGL